MASRSDRRFTPAPLTSTRLALARLALAAVAAFAASPAATAAPTAPPAAATAAAHDPSRAQAEVPRPAYRSAFAGYRAWRDQPVGDWRALNDRVGRIGGWRTYLREAQQPEPGEAGATPAAPAAGATPAAPPPAQPGVRTPGPHHGTHPGPQGGSPR